MLCAVYSWLQEQSRYSILWFESNKVKRRSDNLWRQVNQEEANRPAVRRAVLRKAARRRAAARKAAPRRAARRAVRRAAPRRAPPRSRAVGNSLTVLRSPDSEARNNFPQAHTTLFDLHGSLTKDDGLRELSRPAFLFGVPISYAVLL